MEPKTQKVNRRGQVGVGDQKSKFWLGSEFYFPPMSLTQTKMQPGAGAQRSAPGVQRWAGAQQKEPQKHPLLVWAMGKVPWRARESRRMHGFPFPSLTVFPAQPLSSTMRQLQCHHSSQGCTGTRHSRPRSQGPQATMPPLHHIHHLLSANGQLVPHKTHRGGNESWLCSTHMELRDLG
jgi:hypothetical protein